MKKFTVISLAALLILAFGATAFAQDKLEFKASGFLDVQTHLEKNDPPLNPAGSPIYGIAGSHAAYIVFNPLNNKPVNGLNKTEAYWDTRWGLRFDASMGKDLHGVLQFEIDAARWGNSQGGVRPGSEAHAVGVWSTDRTAVEVKYMYMDIGLPYFGIPVPMSVRVGAQPLAVRPWFFQATDGMGISGGIKIDPVTINPLYFKPAEGVDWVADDCDIWGLQTSAKISTFNLGGYGLYYNMNNYPMGGNAENWPPVIAPAYNAGIHKADFWWLGFYADGKAGPVNIQFDAAYDNGKVRNGWMGNAGATLAQVLAPDVKYSGWATRGKISYPFEKFDFGFVGMYASGSDAKKTSATGLPGSTTSDGTFSDKVSGWMVPVGSEQAATNGALVEDSVVFYGVAPGASGGNGWAVNHNYAQSSKGGLGGTWFAKLYGSYAATPWYKITIQGLYIGDTTKNGNTYGTAWQYPYMPVGPLSSLRRDDNTIGVELDLIQKFQIWKNVDATLYGGYLFAGAAMDMGLPVVGNFSMHDPWAVRFRLRYMF
jgi:hypothetical protein